MATPGIGKTAAPIHSPFGCIAAHSVTQKPAFPANQRLCGDCKQIFLPRISALIHFRLLGSTGGLGMNVIVFASRKGGSGKSTLAAHLAAHVNKATKPCLLIDADPQGSLTLWHKLRGTNEPPIKAAVNSVSGIVAAAKRDGIECVFIDTPPNLSAVVDDAIRNPTMVIIPARPAVLHANAGQETIQTCRTARKPYAVVINDAPAQ